MADADDAEVGYDDFEFGDEGQEDEMENRDIDPEYELRKEETLKISPHEWKTILEKANFSEDVTKKLKAIKPFERQENSRKIVPTSTLKNFFEGTVIYLNSGVKIPPKVMKSLCSQVFAKCDLLFGISEVLRDSVKDLLETASWWNVFNFLRFIPDPSVSIASRLYNVEYHYLKGRRRNSLINAFQSTWLEIMKSDKIPNKVLIAMLPHLSDNVLGTLKEPHRTADFFFRQFRRGDHYAILSLGAIFKLIVNHNFEYPQFYDQVYSLCQPQVLYMEHKKKFLELLDIFLSSTHIPNYIVAGFIKKLSRMLLVAPLDAQEPVLGLIRNLITRHPVITSLVHREIPASMQGDPYDDQEQTLSKTGAMESSLWEIKALQRHWHSDIAKRANFVDKGLQKMESFVRMRCQDEYFSKMIGKKFGKEANIESEKFSKMQDGSDEEDEPQTKKLKFSKNVGKFARKREVEREQTVPTNYKTPSGSLLPSDSFNFTYTKFWSV